jgi:hypothetical protein
MPAFSPELGHQARRAFRLLHQLVEHSHCFFELVLADENPSLERVEIHSDVKLALQDSHVPLVQVLEGAILHHLIEESHLLTCPTQSFGAILATFFQALARHVCCHPH